MKKHYRIREASAAAPSEAEAGRYRDFGKLLYNYQRMTRPLYKRPLYKDPKAFLVVLMIVLMAILIAEVVEKEKTPATIPAPGQQP